MADQRGRAHEPRRTPPHPGRPPAAWTSPEGRPCYLLGDGTGYVSRLADEIEDVQLGMAGELLGHASELLAERRVTSAELHYLARRLTESLRDVKRIAESRGGRLVRSPGHDLGGN